MEIESAAESLSDLKRIALPFVLRMIDDNFLLLVKLCPSASLKESLVTRAPRRKDRLLVHSAVRLRLVLNLIAWFLERALMTQPLAALVGSLFPNVFPSSLGLYATDVSIKNDLIENCLLKIDRLIEWFCCCVRKTSYTAIVNFRPSFFCPNHIF